MLHVLAGTHPPGDPGSDPDLPTPPPPEPPPPPSPPLSTPTAAAVTGTKLGNPISMLNEYAQHHQLPAPGYTYTADGPGNEPTFTATATLDQRTAKGTGATKNTAKTRAAAALWGQLTGQG